MVRRIIKSDIEARKSLAKGAKILANAVRSTFGPFGQNWFLDKRNTITNDGVSVAREIQLPDEVENRGATAIREAAIKTVDAVGEGTSGAIILADGIYDVMAPLLPKQGVRGKIPGAQLIKQLEKERVEVTEKLMAMATPVDTEEQLIASGKVSTEDEDLGTLIGKAQFAVGPDGYLLAEETAERTSSVEIVKGIRIDNGFGTSQIVTNQDKQTLEVVETAILLTSYSIKTVEDWAHILSVYEKIFKSGKTTELVVIARAWTDLTVNFALQNINKGAHIYPLNGPYQDMQERFKDIAAVTGATFYDVENSDFNDIELKGIGFAQKVVARRFDAIIAGLDNDDIKKAVDARVGELAMKSTGSESDFEKKQLSERMAQLRNGFGIVKVGSSSDMERKRLYDKAEDAVNAVRAAYQEGTVPGAGLAFKTIADSLPDSYILKRPLAALYEQIMATAPEGFVIEDWVRDPVKVLRVALANACTSAGSFATAGGVVTQAFPKQIDELMRTNQAATGEEG